MLHVQSRVCLSSAYFFACEVYFGDIVYHSYTGKNMTRKSDDEGKGEEVTPMMMVVKMMVTMMTMMIMIYDNDDYDDGNDDDDDAQPAGRDHALAV